MLLVVSPVALGLISPSAAAASGGYVGGTGDAAVVCLLPSIASACVGGHTFAVPADAEEATVRIEDAVTDPTGGFYRFIAEDGSTISQDVFCDDAQVAVPPGAVKLGVAVREAFGPANCGQIASFGTVGQVHVTWT